MENILDFYKNKNVFITGHTGFKGSWLCKILTMAGANVTGYALSAPTQPNLFELSGVEKDIKSVTGDIRDYGQLKAAFDEAKPEIVIHLAAQPIVRESYARPRRTYETNVMGTVNILECVRFSETVKSFLNVTTDKVYKNSKSNGEYSEDEPLDGFDPYSNSKSCSELVTHCYKNSFLSAKNTAVSTARTGNVIGGGDFAKDRIIPDCVRAAASGTEVIVRNPYSTRPFQHVLEPLFAYLMIAQKQYGDIKYAGYYNVGPRERDCVNTGTLVKMFSDSWGGIPWKIQTEENAPHEVSFLRLDCSKIKNTFGWKSVWHINDAIDKTVEWTRVYFENGDIDVVMRKQIAEYMKE